MRCCVLYIRFMQNFSSHRIDALPGILDGSIQRDTVFTVAVFGIPDVLGDGDGEMGGIHGSIGLYYLTTSGFVDSANLNRSDTCMYSQSMNPFISKYYNINNIM
jgi:hypothetical protein